MHTHNRRILLLLSTAALLHLASMFKITSTWGSWSFYFTGLSIVAPLLGAFLLTHEIMALVLGVAIMRWLGFGANAPMLMLTFGLPTLASSLVFRVSPFGKTAERDMPGGLHTSRRLRNATDRMLTSYADACLRVVLPLVAMLLFSLHPVGGKAALYSVYWLVPVVLYGAFAFKPSLRSHRSFSLLATALSATFVAHCVGSIMWLYNINLTAEYWLRLVPIVPVERVLLAGGIAILYVASQRVVHIARSVKSKILATA